MSEFNDVLQKAWLQASNSTLATFVEQYKCQKMDDVFKHRFRGFVKRLAQALPYPEERYYVFQFKFSDVKLWTADKTTLNMVKEDLRGESFEIVPISTNMDSDYTWKFISEEGRCADAVKYYCNKQYEKSLFFYNPQENER